MFHVKHINPRYCDIFRETSVYEGISFVKHTIKIHEEVLDAQQQRLFC